MRYPSEEGYDRAAAELADRRQRARETFYDRCDTVALVNTALNEAIETATRIRITDEIAFARPLGPFVPDGDERRAIIKAAFEAAGFEVEQ